MNTVYIVCVCVQRMLCRVIEYKNGEFPKILLELRDLKDECLILWKLIMHMKELINMYHDILHTDFG